MEVPLKFAVEAQEKEEMMDQPKPIAEWTRRFGKNLQAASSLLRLPAIAMAIGLVAGTPVASQELVRLPMFGGYGGNNFEHLCGPGRVLVGVNGYAGVWVDNIQAVCARFETNGVADPQREGPVFGGDRPITKGSTCYHLSTANYLSTVVATGLELDVNKHNRFLGYIRLVCAHFTSNNLTKPVSFPLSGTGLLASEPSGSSGSELFVKPVRQECPAGLVAVGIRGRAGRFLDALGLVCGPRPAPPETNTRTLGKRKRNTATLNKRKLRTPEQSTEVSQPVRPPVGEPVPPPNPAPPFITANPAVVVVAADQTRGTTILTWHGGANHPYAEVWVKVDGADETFIVEQGQGTRQQTVERGKTYVFILTDAGQRLATVTVTVKP